MPAVLRWRAEASASPELVEEWNRYGFPALLIDDALALADHVEVYRADYNHVRPHEAIAWNRPADVHAGRADPTIPHFELQEILPAT